MLDLVKLRVVNVLRWMPIYEWRENQKEPVREGEHATTFGMEKRIQQPFGHYYIIL